MVMKASGVLKVWVTNPEAELVGLTMNDIEEIKFGTGFERATIKFMDRAMVISWGSGRGKWTTKIRDNGRAFVDHAGDKSIKHMEIGKITGLILEYFQFI
jgi:hypothetical protein